MFSALNFFLAGSSKGTATVIQAFTASGNWTVPTGVTSLKIGRAHV